jgi:coenzyme PQQ precursor peptide PqqA
MEWEKPEFVEVSLACEISSYANAELSESPAKAPSSALTNE